MPSATRIFTHLWHLQGLYSMQLGEKAKKEYENTLFQTRPKACLHLFSQGANHWPAVIPTHEKSSIPALQHYAPWLPQDSSLSQSVLTACSVGWNFQNKTILTAFFICDSGSCRNTFSSKSLSLLIVQKILCLLHCGWKWRSALSNVRAMLSGWVAKSPSVSPTVCKTQGHPAFL